MKDFNDIESMAADYLRDAEDWELDMISDQDHDFDDEFETEVE